VIVVRFLSLEKTKEWIERRFGSPPNTGPLVAPGEGDYHQVQAVVTGLEPPRLYYLIEEFVSALQSWDRCLVRIQDPGLGGADLNLYYRLRQSYGDYALLDEAPGHLFLDHETRDLRTFVAVCIMNAWDADLLPDSGYARAHLSHDGWVALGSPHDYIVDAFETRLKERALAVSRL
jgi:hypothetical protein